MDRGEAVLSVPRADKLLGFELGKAGVHAKRIVETPVDVRALREELRLTQQEFALRYNLRLRALQNWEQGRTPNEIAASYLRVIARQPHEAAAAQEIEWGSVTARTIEHAR